ncbi:glycoside hydrolase family 19 protein [Pseudoalteromonas xiamenensis]|uniref:glycoside hydrolase family 19 protein n=1 Tax=Pseudoalteromonas xiamenensis TaxID=882626 RepID=UPI0027E416DA|nr:glycoside hydrolase family 19 protein [Pseudoalteromonas xiamenensis]WMN58674.1 glycoside hydrolase family 19 protein [Pseudoalteromonas xiamenensis]
MQNNISLAVDCDSICQIVPTTSASILHPFVDPLNNHFSRFSINTPLRIAHFLAQVAHESGGFRHRSENLNYSATALRNLFAKYFPNLVIAESYARKPEAIANRIYASRMGNGTEASGDGWRFRGRGLIQLTGRENYLRCGQWLGENLVSEPERVAEDLNICVLSACWYWQSKRLNTFADEDDILHITRRINGGLHGLEERKAYLDRAKAVFAKEFNL